jgi:hypothetical protein
LSVILAALASGCTEPLCGNDPLAAFDSPDGRLQAIVYLRACGATTGYSTHVSVLERNGHLRGAGNVLTADFDHGRVPATPENGPLANIHWLSPDELEVTYDARARVFKRESTIAGVKIIYRSRIMGMVYTD